MGSLRSEAEKSGITVLTYEAGEALRFEPIAISAGVVGVKRVMQMAYINSPLGNVEVEVKANKGGIVIGQQTLPLVNEGDAVFHLAYFTQNDDMVEQLVGDFIEEFIEVDLEPLTTGQIMPPSPSE